MARKERKLRDPRHDHHHIRPRSRGGGWHGNITVLPVKFHALWHQLFVNLTVEEVHVFIDTIMVPGTSWNYKSLNIMRDRLMRQRMAS